MMDEPDPFTERDEWIEEGVKRWATDIATGNPRVTGLMTAIVTMLARAARHLPPDERAMVQAHLHREAEKMRWLQ
jgi:hypothetical protein